MNAKWEIGPGDWMLTGIRQTIKGFADKVSVGEGEVFSLYVTTPAPSFDVSVYRLGWYDKGARSAELVDQIRQLRGSVQPPAQLDVPTGLISAANWTPSTTLRVSGWRTGVYLLKLVGADGDQNYIPLVVRDDREPHDVLFVHSVNTDQAYNGWGGKSLYAFNSTGPLTVGGTVAGVKASFDRPFDQDGSGTAILSWELNMVRWLEANNFDVAYTTDLDMHQDGQFAARSRAVIQAGHSEYWSKEMRDHLEEASRAGKGLGFFTGDTGSWAVRYEDSPLGRNRVLVCYRKAELDPLTATDPSRTTTHWLSPPLNRPTQAFFGIGSNALVARSADWIVAGVEDAPDLFAETGFKNGDVVVNLVGYEYDGLWTPGAGKDLPHGLTLLGRASVIPASPLEVERQFAVRYDWSESPPLPLGRLATTIETLHAGPSWTLMVNVKSSVGQVYLQYETQTGTPYHNKVGQATYAIIPLAADYSQVGTRPLDRDLTADYTLAFGKPPADAHIVAVVVRGSLAMGAISMTGLDGSVRTTRDSVGRFGDKNAWYIADGRGTLGVRTGGPSGSPSLVIQAALPTDKRANEADTVQIKRPNNCAIIAVGTMQWSWALDNYGKHVDKTGNVTKVDPRLQALTRNMIRKLITGTR